MKSINYADLSRAADIEMGQLMAEAAMLKPCLEKDMKEQWAFGVFLFWCRLTEKENTQERRNTYLRLANIVKYEPIHLPEGFISNETSSQEAAK